MRILTAGLIITTAFTVAWTRHRINQWQDWVRTLEEQLLWAPEAGIDGDALSPASWESLPPAVRTYLEAVLPPRFRGKLDGGSDDDDGGGVLSIHSLVLHQEGHFYFGSAWVPFEARQIVRGSSPAGFLWDATISVTDRFRSSRDLQDSWWPTMQVCDAWVDGGRQAYMRAALANVFEAVSASSTISDEDDDDAGEDRYLWVGQAMRWLAEAVLVPTVLLPSRGLVEWSDGDGDTAVLSLVDPRGGGGGIPSSRHVAAVRLEVEFDPDTGLMVRARGLRPYEREVLDRADDLFPLFARKRTSWEWRQWEGRMSRYVVQEDGPARGVVVPTRMEAGWVVDGESGGEVEDYFRADNVVLEYRVVLDERSGPTTMTTMTAEAVVPEAATLV